MYIPRAPKKDPKAWVRWLLRLVPIETVIGEYVPLSKRRSRGKDEYIAVCPFHKERTGSFSVAGHKGIYHCFGCGAHGNALNFLQEYLRLSYAEAIKHVARVAGVEVPPWFFKELRERAKR